ncbi:MAG: hypothetical protein ABRQ37_04390, partial [Candidatus Eremiobacterota bacterium]
MNYKILLLDSNRAGLEKETRELEQGGLTVAGATNFTEACNMLKEDGAIHAVLTEWELPVNNSKTSGKIEGFQMFQEFLKIRYEIFIYLFTSEKNARASGGIINGYFYKGDRDYDDIIRKITSEV